MAIGSKVCKYCGNIVESESDEYNVNDVIDMLEENLQDIKNLPEPTFLHSLLQLTYIVFPIMALYLLILSLLSEAGLFWILTVIFGVLAIIQLRKKFKGRLGNDLFNNQFKTLKVEAESLNRMAKNSYGESDRIKRLLTDISSEIAAIEESRKKATQRNIIIWIVVVAVFLICATKGYISISDIIDEAQQLKQGIEEF